MNNFDLTEYIKSQLYTYNYKTTKDYSDNKKISKKCLQDIGKSLGDYTNFRDMLNPMSDCAIRELSEEIGHIQFYRKRFTDFVNCSREEADKPADNNRSIGYFTYGEMGGEYGYFKHICPLTEEQQEWLNDYTECCYYNGQPCERWQNGNDDEDCECVLGHGFSTLILYELDECEEKRLGIWKQDITWSLNGYGGNYNDDYFFSLQKLKKEALDECLHEKKNEKGDCIICDKIMAYDGQDLFEEGNIKIKVIHDGENESEKITVPEKLK